MKIATIIAIGTLIVMIPLVQGSIKFLNLENDNLTIGEAIGTWTINDLFVLNNLTVYNLTWVNQTIINQNITGHLNVTGNISAGCTIWSNGMIECTNANFNRGGTVLDILDGTNYITTSNFHVETDGDIFGVPVIGDGIGSTLTFGDPALINLALDVGADLSVSGDVHIDDNKKYYVGTGNDASMYYDGTHPVINPREVGSGILFVSDNSRADFSSASRVGIWTDASTFFEAHSYTNSLTSLPALLTRKAAGSSSSPSAIINGMDLGGILMGGYDGTKFMQHAAFYSVSDGPAGTDYVPMAISLRTGNTSIAERVLIGSDGNVTIKKNTTFEENMTVNENATFKKDAYITDAYITNLHGGSNIELKDNINANLYNISNATNISAVEGNFTEFHVINDLKVDGNTESVTTSTSGNERLIFDTVRGTVSAAEEAAFSKVFDMGANYDEENDIVMLRGCYQNSAGGTVKCETGTGYISEIWYYSNRYIDVIGGIEEGGVVTVFIVRKA